MKIIRHLKTLWDDETRIITNQEELIEYSREVRERGKNPNPTTISFDDIDNHDTPYEWNKEYLKIVKRNNHETIYRIRYE